MMLQRSVGVSVWWEGDSNDISDKTFEHKLDEDKCDADGGTDNKELVSLQIAHLITASPLQISLRSSATPAQLCLSH